ncbi:MAG TPA: hypothetical protein VGI17_09080 [Solirubrobacterales bacterium]
MTVTLIVLTPAFVKAQPAHAAGCANEAIRQAQGAAALALPDCRAYELVTPGAQPFIATDGEVDGSLASTTGGGLAYVTRYPAQEAVTSGERYLATRGASAWSVESAAPQDSPGSSILFNCEQGLNFTADLSESILSDGWNAALDSGNQSEGQCQEVEEVLVPGAPRGYGNIFLREGGAGTAYKLVNVTPAGVTPGNALLRGYTQDLTHIFFEDGAPLTQNASPGGGLYEWSAGALTLVSVLPSGEPVAGSLADQSDGSGFYSLAQINHSFSDDGEEVFFYANGKLYLRKNATQPPTQSGTCSPAEANRACTIQVDDGKLGGTTASGGGVFWTATEDGSRVFFSDAKELTGDSRAQAGEPDLYELNLNIGLLRDLTHTAAPERPDLSGFSGFSQDRSMLYFVGSGVLEGAGANAAGEVAQAGSANLYLLDEGKLSFVVSGVSERTWTINGFLATAVSPDGRYFAFTSSEPLTGFDNTPQSPGQCEGGPCEEIFLFDAQDKKLECVSCSSGRPTGDTELSGPSRFSGKSGPAPVSLPRQVLDDGQVFFTTPNALVPQDLNGTKDVYEYDEGRLSLLSSGAATGDSVFFEADPSGSNVFFATSQGLVPSDTNNGLSIYDARVEGGFPEPPAVPPCEGEGCRGPASVPVGAATAPGSAGFEGAEEGPRHPRKSSCKRGFVRRHGKCVKKPPRRSKKRHHKPSKHGSSTRRNAK